MQIAYLVLAHKLPAQVLRLARSLAAHSTGPILIHVDRKHPQTFRQLLNARDLPSQAWVVSDIAVHWGHISVIDALIRGLELILDAYPQVTHIKHLSGQDYPVRPLAELATILREHDQTSFIDFKRLPNPIWLAGGEIGGGMNRVTNAYLRVGERMIRLPLKRPPPHLALYGGSALWCLYRDHARYIIENRSQLRRTFRWAAFADELFFQTALLNAPFAACVHNNGMTYMAWNHGEPHPKVLRCEDLGAIRESGCWFARKFDTSVDAQVLDELDHCLAAD